MTKPDSERPYEDEENCHILLTGRISTQSSSSCRSFRQSSSNLSNNSIHFALDKNDEKEKDSLTLDGDSNSDEPTEAATDPAVRVQQVHKRGQTYGSGLYPLFGPRGATIKEYDNVEVCELENDSFSLMMVSPVTSRAFLFSIFVFMFQVCLASLIIYDFLNGAFGFNRLKLPIDVGPEVAVGQVLALVIATFSQDDMRSSISMIAVGFDNHLCDKRKFMLANSCRFVEGFLTTFVAFLFIVRSNSVLEIFVNFAAVEFISNLDNLAFELAVTGYVGKSVKQLALKAAGIQLDINHITRMWIAQAIFYLVGLGMFIGWLFCRLSQQHGVVLAATSCSAFQVKFGGEIFEIPRGERVTLEGSSRQTRQETLGRFDPATPPPMMYSFFSGRYETLQQELSGVWKDQKGLQRINGRPVYKQSGIDDTTSGTFYYCKGIGAWVFTIPALGEALPQKGVAECGPMGWLMRSGSTDAFILENVDPNVWEVWTGTKLNRALEFRYKCAGCKTDTDCDYSHGKCHQQTGKCECFDGWAGHSCQLKQPFCPQVNYMYLCSKPSSFWQDGPYDILLHEDNSPILIQDRPVYAGSYKGSDVVFFYGGRRWFVSRWDQDTALDVFNDKFHAFWDAVLDPKEALLISDETESHTPEGHGLSWNRPTVARSSMGLKDPMARFRIAVAVVLCHEYCDPDGEDDTFCGLYGTCHPEKRVCECNNFAAGPYCQYEPGGSYMGDTWDELQEALQNPNIDPDEHFSELQFYDAFWKRQVAELRASNETMSRALRELESVPRRNTCDS